MREEQALLNKETDPEGWQEYEDAIDAYKTDLLADSGYLTEYMQKFLALPEEALTDSQKSLMTQMSGWSAILLKELDPNQYRAIKWEEIFNAKEFSSAKDELIKAASESRTAATLDDVKEKFGSSLYKSLEESLAESDFSMQDFIDSINSEAGILDMDKVRPTRHRFH